MDITAFCWANVGTRTCDTGEGWAKLVSDCPKFEFDASIGLFNAVRAFLGPSCAFALDPMFIVGIGRIVGLGVEAKIFTKGVTACKTLGCLVVGRLNGWTELIKGELVVNIVEIVFSGLGVGLTGDLLFCPKLTNSSCPIGLDLEIVFRDPIVENAVGLGVLNIFVEGLNVCIGLAVVGGSEREVDFGSEMVC